MLHTGLFVQRDAISSSVRAKVTLLDKWSAAGSPISWNVRCLASDASDSRVSVETNIGRSYLDRSFLDAHVHIYEFGMYYSLFDSIFAVPGDASKLGVYHNITPIELVHEDVRERVGMSTVQRSNLTQCQEIACDSRFNLEELCELGFPSHQLSLLHLPPAMDLDREPPAVLETPRARLLFVGRLVTAKGLLVLIEAVNMLKHSDVGPFEMTFAGSLDFAEESVRAAIEGAQDLGILTCVFDAPDDALASLYRDADIFVMPSFHEGYCVPIVEALSAGCQIVSSDAGNLPNIVGDLGQIVPARDAGALYSALVPLIRSINAGECDRVHDRWGWVSRDAWTLRVDGHLALYSTESFEIGFAALLQRAVKRSSWSGLDHFKFGPTRSAQ
jgi:glycosyltransferase involved in cell wall biosynthesis